MIDNNDIDINVDDTSKKYRHHMAGYLYNLFVKQENVKTKLILGPEKVATQTLKLNNALSTQEQYTATLNTGIAYSTNIRRGFGNITIDFTFETVQPMDTFNSANIGKGSNSTKIPSGFAFDDGFGNSNPVLFACFNSDPLNKLNSDCSVKMGNGGEAVAYGANLSSNQKAILNRIKYGPENYDDEHLMIPDNAISYNYFIPRDGVDLAKACITVDQPCPTFLLNTANTSQGIDMNPDNVFSTIYGRNRHFKDFTWTFSKTIASPNFQLNATNDKWVQTAATTALFTVWINEKPYPTPFANLQAIVSGTTEAKGTAIFAFFQKYLYYPIATYDYWELDVADRSIEPAGQQIKISISIANPESPLHNPILHSQAVTSYSNTDRLEININSYRPNFLVKLPPMSTYVMVSTPQVTLSSPYLTFNQYNIPITILPSVAKTTTLPYYHIDSFRTSFTIDYNNPVKEFTSASAALNVLPEYAIIDLNRTVATGTEYKYPDEMRMNITGLIVDFDGNGTSMTNITARQLYEMTKRNLVKDYSLKDWKGRYMKAVTYNFAQNNQTCTNQNLYGGSVWVPGNGSFLVLRYGVDIPTPNTTAGVAMGTTANVKYTLTTDGILPGGLNSSAGGNIELEVMHLYPSEYRISTQLTEATRALFSNSDYTEALQLFNAKATRGKLYINADKIRGGGIFSSIKNAVSSVLPKVLPAIQKGVEIYKQVAPVAKQIGQLANNNIIKSDTLDTVLKYM